MTASIARSLLRRAHLRRLHRTTSYQFKSVEQAADLFALYELGNIYTRLGGPTADVLEKRLALMHGAPEVGALACASGTVAVFQAILNVAEMGDNIVGAAPPSACSTRSLCLLTFAPCILLSALPRYLLLRRGHLPPLPPAPLRRLTRAFCAAANNLYGGTMTMFEHILPKMGITCTFVDPNDPRNFVGDFVNDKTRAFYCETVANPSLDIADLVRPQGKAGFLAETVPFFDKTLPLCGVAGRHRGARPRERRAAHCRRHIHHGVSPAAA